MGSENAAARPLLPLSLGPSCTLSPLPLFPFVSPSFWTDFYILKNFSDEGDFSISSDMRISSGNQVENCGAYRNPQTSKILLDYLKSGLFSWFWRNNRACGREFCVRWVDFIKILWYNIYRRDGKDIWAGFGIKDLYRIGWQRRSLCPDPLTRSRKANA